MDSIPARAVVTALILAAGLVTRTHAEDYLGIEAYSGKPLGVCRLHASLDRGHRVLGISEKDRRLHYPAYTFPAKSETTGNAAGKLDLYFLFQGEKPIEISVELDSGKQWLRVIPESNEAKLQAQKKSWAERYVNAANERTRLGSPPQLDNYLCEMLNRRLAVSMSAYSPWSWRTNVFFADDLVDTLAGTESIRIAMQKDTYLTSGDRLQITNQPMPKPIAVPSLPVPAYPVNVQIEPIASHVPEECFYVRCGSYENFRWLRSMLSRQGASLRNMGSQRGLDFEILPRLERQIALQETELARLFGNSVIEDVAIIGTDPFVREGAAFGILFQARNNSLLKTAIEQQRREALARESGAAESTKSFGDRTSSFLHTEDNRVRSFYLYCPRSSCGVQVILVFSVLNMDSFRRLMSWNDDLPCEKRRCLLSARYRRKCFVVWWTVWSISWNRLPSCFRSQRSGGTRKIT